LIDIKTMSNNLVDTGTPYVGGLSEQVAHVLSERIIEGELTAGTYLPPEPQLAEEFGVSRTVVREATRVLMAKGLVEVQRGRGVLVRKPATEETVTMAFSWLLRQRSVTFWHLWQMRVILETEVAGLAALYRTPTQLYTLRQSMLRMENPDASLEDLVEADLHFHHTLAVAASNPLLELIFQAVTDLMRASRKLTLGLSGARRALRGHVAIFAAVEQGDATAARERMRAHLEEVKEDLESQPDNVLVFDPRL
jgi:GntR family transcriptional repressor for pyruvate dehydrogenase complex